MENSLEFKHIIYITVNTVNGKFYIGVHKTDTPDKFDGYLGCGAWLEKPSSYNKGKTPLHAAILKYGTSAFKRITIKVFDNRQDALNLEKILVTKEFISQPNNYNATIGGGNPPLSSIPTNQFTLDGQFVKTWESEESIRQFFGVKVSMSDVIKCKCNMAGYFWSRASEIDVNEYQKIVKGGFIDQYDLQGNYLTSYRSTNIASQKLDISFSKLTTAIFRQKPCEGYYFIKSGADIAEIFKIKRTINKQPVHRYLMSGEFDKTYSTTVQAARDTPHTQGINIKNAVVNGGTAGGYRWSYSKGENYFQLQNPTQYRKIPRVLQYTVTGKLVKIWNNYRECKREFPYCLDVCNGKAKAYRGYVFKYEETKDIV